MSDQREVQSSGDIRQVGLTESADKKLKEILSETKWFEQEQDIYRVAVAVALAKGWHDEKWARGQFEGQRDTKTRTVLLDDRGILAKLVEMLAPDCGGAPYRYSQGLAIAGVNFLHQELVERLAPLGDALGFEEVEADGARTD